MKSQLNNEKGATLIFVLVIFVFISIIAIGVISVATNESLQAIEKNKKIQAEYLALSGIQIMTEYIENYYDDFVEKYEDYDNNFPVEFDSSDLGEDGKVTVEILKDDDTEQLQIVSTGEYEGVIYKKKRNITLTKMPVSNDLPESFYVSSEDIPNYKPVEVPEHDIQINNINIKNNNSGSLVLNENVTKVDTIDLKGDLDIQADVIDYKTNRTLIVNSFTAGEGSGLSIHPNLTLYLYILEDSSFNEGVTFDDNGMIVMMVDSGAQVTFNVNAPTGSDPEFNAFVYGPDANFDFKNNVDFLGFVIGEEEDPKLVGQAEGTYLEPTPDLKEFFMQNIYDEYERFVPQDYVK